MNNESTSQRSSDSYRFWRRNGGVYLIEVEGDLALFYRLGQRLYVEAPGLGAVLPQLWEQLEAGLSENHFFDPLIFANLQRLQLIVLVAPAESAEHRATPAVRDLAELLRWSAAGLWVSHHRSHEAPDNFQTVAADILETPIVIADLGLGFGIEELREAFGLLGFSRVQIVPAQEARSSVPRGGWGILWGRWGKTKRLAELADGWVTAGRNYLVVMEDQVGGSVGPAYVGPGTPCFHCLVKRRESNLFDRPITLKLEEFFEQSSNTPFVAFAPFRRRLAELAAFELVKLIGRPIVPKVLRGVQEFDFLNHHSRFHEVVPLPFCPVCSQSRRQPGAAWGDS